VKVADPGVEGEKFFRLNLCCCLAQNSAHEDACSLSFLTPCESVRLPGGVVAPGGEHHLLVVDSAQARKFSKSGSGAGRYGSPLGHRRLPAAGSGRSSPLRAPMPLKAAALHEPILVHSHPYPVPYAIYRCTHLVQMPARTPAGSARA